MTSQLAELKKRVCDANLEIPKRGLAIYTFGNASAIDRKKSLIAIKPSGVSYDELTPDQIVVVDLDCNQVEGAFRPSSDTKTHIALYKAFPKIGGIVHTHSTYATGWAQAKKPIPCFGTTHADHLTIDVPCTEVMSDEQIRGDYEEETGNQIIETFKNFSYEDVQMVLIACHGPFTWGDSVEKAIYNSAVLEELAKMAFLTLSINPSVSGLKDTLKDKHYFRKHGAKAYYGQK